MDNSFSWNFPYEECFRRKGLSGWSHRAFSSKSVRYEARYTKSVLNQNLVVSPILSLTLITSASCFGKLQRDIKSIVHLCICADKQLANIFLLVYAYLSFSYTYRLCNIIIRQILTMRLLNKFSNRTQSFALFFKDKMQEIFHRVQLWHVILAGHGVIMNSR